MSTTSSRVRLPQELVDHILDHLFDDHQTLAACSLVSKSWLPTSRHHLFAKVCLQAHGLTSFPSARCKGLLSVIQRAPELSDYIRELEICEGVGFQAWVASEPALLQLFKKLRNLRHLEISASASTFYWKTLPAAFQNALCSLLAASTSLTYLKLHSWLFPDFSSLAVLLSHCKGLKGLSLSSTTVQGDVENPHEQRLKCVIEEREGCDVIHSAKLEVLTLDYVNFCYLESWLFGDSPTVDVSTLRELRVSHFSDSRVIRKLLSAVSDSLEHLHLKPAQWAVCPMDLSSTTNLRSLRMTLDEPGTAMRWADTLLSSLRSASACVIERIALEFFVDLKILADAWGQLAALLLHPEFSTLRQLEVGIFAPPTSQGFARVEAQLAGLKAHWRPPRRTLAGEIEPSGATNARAVTAANCSSRNGNEESELELRVYQLGLKSQKSKRQLSPRISRYETGGSRGTGRS